MVTHTALLVGTMRAKKKSVIVLFYRVYNGEIQWLYYKIALNGITRHSSGCGELGTLGMGPFCWRGNPGFVFSPISTIRVFPRSFRNVPITRHCRVSLGLDGIYRLHKICIGRIPVVYCMQPRMPLSWNC